LFFLTTRYSLFNNVLVTIYHQNPNIVKSAGNHPLPIDSVSLKGAVIVDVVCDVDHHCVTPP
jgi:hypothetical protein